MDDVEVELEVAVDVDVFVEDDVEVDDDDDRDVDEVVLVEVVVDEVVLELELVEVVLLVVSHWANDLYVASAYTNWDVRLQRLLVVKQSRPARETKRGSEKWRR